MRQLLPNHRTFTRVIAIASLLFLVPASWAGLKLANPTEEPDPQSVTLIMTGVIDEIDDPTNSIPSKVVSVGSVFTSSVTFKPGEEDFSWSMFETMPASWEVSFGSVDAFAPGLTLETHWDESFGNMLWFRNTGFGSDYKRVPVKQFPEVSGLPKFLRLTGVAFSFVSTSDPTPDTIADAIDQDFLYSFYNSHRFYARISPLFGFDLADIHGTITVIEVQVND